MVILRSLVSNPYSPYLAVLKLVANTLSYLTPVINPCVYAFFNENFRKSFIEILYQVTCRQPKPAADTLSTSEHSVKQQKAGNKNMVVVWIDDDYILFFELRDYVFFLF